MRLFLKNRIERIKERTRIIDEANKLFREKYLNGEIDFQCKVSIPVLGQSVSDYHPDAKIFSNALEFNSIDYMSNDNIKIFNDIVQEHYLNKLMARKLWYLKIYYVTLLFNSKFKGTIVKDYIG
jgi:hypothetical protein